jgi:hypothetical protein
LPKEASGSSKISSVAGLQPTTIDRIGRAEGRKNEVANRPHLAWSMAELTVGAAMVLFGILSGREHSR